MALFCKAPVLWWTVVALFALSGLVKGSETSEPKVVEISNFDDKFLTFLEEHHYKAGSVGIMQDGKLVYAKGFSLEKEKKSKIGNPLSVSLSSSFSKTITAVAILRLVEAGRLQLHQTVFCSQGILHKVKPWNISQVADPRICDITVDHLLHHTSGWDAKQAPMFDPLLNQYYVSMGDKVPNIASVLGAATPYHIMRFMLGRKLHYAPGTKMVYSNFDYSILGRVIVEASGTSYESYVKKFILDSCGMWHTRLGKRHTAKKDLNANEVATLLRDKPTFHPGLFETLGPYVIDSALGWYSNVFDIMRFMRCLDGSGAFKLLKSRSLKKLTQRPKGPLFQHSDTWYGAGFHVKNSGELWVDGDHHVDDIVVHHSGLRREKRKGKMSWVMLLEGKEHADLRHNSRQLVKSVKKWPKQDLFISDLTDFRYDPETKFPLIKLKLGEHHLDAFVNAVRFQRQAISWFSAHSTKRGTHFILMTSQADRDSELDYVFESGLSMEDVKRRGKKLKSFGYKLSELRSYISRSHSSEESYACVFKKLPDEQNSKIGLQVEHMHYQDVYSKLTHSGFMPKIQSVTANRGYHVNYVFEKKTEKNFKGYIGVKLPELDEVMQTNAKANRGLAFLDATIYNNAPSFSAVFKHSSATSSWVFNVSLSERDLHKNVVDLKLKGLVPRIIVRVPSTEKKDVRFVAYFSNNE